MEHDMEYRRLGSSGLMVSRIGLGMMSYGDPGKQQWGMREDEAEPTRSPLNAASARPRSHWPGCSAGMQWPHR
jgi:hypothetical protein